MADVVLNVLPSESDSSRLVLAMEGHGQSRRFVLRQETHSSDVGWFVQNRIVIEPEQARALKASISSKQVDSKRRAKNQPTPVILKFTDALAAS